MKTCKASFAAKQFVTYASVTMLKLSAFAQQCRSLPNVGNAAPGRCSRLDAFKTVSAVINVLPCPLQKTSVAGDTVTDAHAPAALQPCAGAAGSAGPGVLWVRQLPSGLLAAASPVLARHLRS